MKNIIGRLTRRVTMITLLFLMALALALLDGAGAPAQPLAGLPLEELTASASLILLGSITSTQAVAPENPYANYAMDVHVEETLKGDMPANITIRYPGPTTDLPSHGTAEVENLPHYVLAPGTRHLFLLEGGAPLQLANLSQGILSPDMLESVRAALSSNPLAATITLEPTTAQPAQAVHVEVQLKNVSTAPVSVQLPQQLGECCRVLCWSAAEQLANPPLKWPRSVESPSEYTLTTLQPGDERHATLTLTVLPNAELTTPQQAEVAICVYLLPQGSTQPRCYATPPCRLTVQPG